jgi:negative regulator of genetic competence, sporulation and motility
LLSAAMGDKVVMEDLFKDAMNGLVSKEKFHDIDCLIASVTDVNKTVSSMATKLDYHMKKTRIDVGSFRQVTSRLNTKIDNVHTQLLEKQGRFDKTHSSLLTVYIRIKVQLDLQADKSSVVVKGPFFPQV